MIDPKAEELLHASMDGQLTNEERAELDHLLESSSDARVRLTELQHMVHRLDELGPAEPPAELTRHVMDAVVARHRDQDHVVTINGGMRMSKKFMIGLSAAAAVVLGVFVIRGYPPIGSGTEGSIGAAKRYQAPQLAAGDVKLGDASAQEFLQSDVFDRLMKDETARKALSDPAMRAMLADPAFAQALNDPALRQALNDPALRQALNDPALRQAMGNSAMAAALNSAAFRMALNNADFRDRFADASFRQALTNANMEAALQSKGFSSALQSAQFEAALRPRQ